jgi:hypothetical protein
MIHFQDFMAHNGRLNIVNEATRTGRFSGYQATAILVHCQQIETAVHQNAIDLDYTNKKKLKSTVIHVRPSRSQRGSALRGISPTQGHLADAAFTPSHLETRFVSDMRN